MIVVGLLFLVCLIFLLRTWWYSCNGRLQFDSSIPSPPVHDIIFGHARAARPMYGEEGIAYFIKWGLIYPKLMKYRAVFYYILLTAHPTYIRAIFKDRPEKHFQYNLAKNWIGDGLLFSKGSKWYTRRKLLTPSFHFDILKSYIDIFNETTNIMVKQLGKLNGEPVEIFQQATSLTLDTILRCLLSYESNCQSLQKNEYADLMYKLSAITLERINNPEKLVDWIFFLSKAGREYLKLRDRFWDIGRELIKKRQEEHKRNPRMLDDVKNLNFLDVLLTLKYEDGTNLTIEDVLEEVNMFVFAGHDTTASAISWSLLQLSQHPQHMTKCYQEICELFNAEDCDEYVTQRHINSLAYFSMCIKECLRLKPPVPYIGRSVAKDVTIEGHFVPKGTMVTVLVDTLHLSEEFWEKPSEFIPERFSVENSRDRDPYSYIPFGVGSRNCIGQNFAMTEFKMTVAKIIYNFELIAVAPEKINRLCAIVQKPENLFLKFLPRRARQ